MTKVRLQLGLNFLPTVGYFSTNSLKTLGTHTQKALAPCTVSKANGGQLPQRYPFLSSSKSSFALIPEKSQFTSSKLPEA